MKMKQLRLELFSDLPQITQVLVGKTGIECSPYNPSSQNLPVSIYQRETKLLCREIVSDLLKKVNIQPTVIKVL